jgi:hypothetical protein
MIQALIIAASLASGAVLPCSGTSCPAVRAFETFTCSAGTCTATAPVAADFSGTAELSIDLGIVASWTVQLCADSGQTLVGAGEMHVYTVNAWNPTLVTRNKALDLVVSAVTSATACAGAACRCAQFPDQEVALRLNGRRLRVIASGITVSSGNLTIYLYGKTQ